MLCVLTFTFCILSFVQSKTIPTNNTAILISKYAKVTRWGVKDNETKPNIDNLGRRSGQALWTHRSDAHLASGQGVKSDRSRVINDYATYKNKHSKIDDEKIERLPAVGEVIQDRYNPRPYFGYTKIPPKSEESATYGVPKQTQSSISGLNLNIAPSTPNSIDPYTSPYSSYNPPPMMSVNSAPETYPPSSADSYAPPLLPNNEGPYDYNPKIPQEPSYASLGPPLAPQYGPDSDIDSMPPNDHDMNPPPSDHTSIDHNSPPHYPPKTEDDIYYPPESFNGGAHEESSAMPAPDMNMKHAPSDYGHFPQYLYDSHHFDHHIYEEIPHTTTEAAEDKRVSSVNYSYYYLGRKLWYIPLYFSIYFIIYVAVLILKAIARHKIQHKQQWITNSRNGREFNLDKNDIENVTKNVTNAIENAKRIYAM